MLSTQYAGWGAKIGMSLAQSGMTHGRFDMNSSADSQVYSLAALLSFRSAVFTSSFPKPKIEVTPSSMSFSKPEYLLESLPRQRQLCRLQGKLPRHSGGTGRGGVSSDIPATWGWRKLHSKIIVTVTNPICPICYVGRDEERAISLDPLAAPLIRYCTTNATVL